MNRQEKCYEVIRDLQGGEFGMGRQFSVEEWRKQAIEWAEMDEMDGIVRELKKLKKQDILPYIASFWTLEFAEVGSVDYKYELQTFDEQDEVESVSSFEDYDKAFNFYNSLTDERKILLRTTKDGEPLEEMKSSYGW